MPRPLFLASDTIKRASDLEFTTNVETGLSNLRFPQMVEEGIKGLRTLAFGDPDATEWTPTPMRRPDPLPIVVSPQPEVQAIRPPVQSEQPRPPVPPSQSQQQDGAVVIDGGSQSAPTIQTGQAAASGGTPSAMPTGQAPDGDILDESSPEAFKRSLRVAAQVVADKYDLPAEIIAAIPIQETGFRVSRLGREGNNLFSIKGEGPAGSMQFSEGAAPEDLNTPFRRYNNAAESFDDFGRLITTQPRYAEAVRVWRETRDPARFIEEVQKAGYATDWGDADGTGIPWWQKVVRISRDMPPLEQAQRATVPPPVSQQAATGEADRYDVAFGFNQAYSTPFNANIPNHRGVDLVVRGAKDNGRGEPVRAFRGGRVVAVTSDPNGGNGLIVQGEDGLYDYYGHFDAIGVRQGDQLAPGQQVGVLGASGTEGFPHLHYEVRRNINGDPMDQLIDPTPYMRLGGGVRNAQPSVVHAEGDGHNHGAPPTAAAPTAAGIPSSPPAGSGPAPAAAPGDAGMGDMPRLALGNPQPFPEDASTEHAMLWQTAVPNEQKPPPLRNIVPWNAEDGQAGEGLTNPAAPLGDGLMPRLPIATDPEATTGAEYDPRLYDEGAREWQPISASTGAITAPPSTASAPHVEPEAFVYSDPDAGPRESGYSMPASTYGQGADDPGTQPVNPVYGPEPMPGPDLPAPEPESPLKPLYDLGGRVVGYVQDRVGQTLGSAPQVAQQAVERAAGPLQAAGNAVVESYNDPLWQTAPAPVRAIQLVREAFSKYGRAAATKLADELGVSNEALFEIFGQPVSGQDIAGFVGETLLDPTNYSPAPAAGAIRSAAGPVAAAVLDPAGSALGAAGQTLGRGVRALGNALPSPTVADDGVRTLGSGFVPDPGSAPRPTVEVLQQRLDAAWRNVQRSLDAGDQEAADVARERAVELESALVDARNARLDLEPRITSDVGRRLESLPLDERSADDLAGVGRERARVQPSELSGPVGIPVDTGPQLRGSGMVPEQGRRLYHGTADAFGRPDPDKFDPDGLFGPGYYLTTDPRVASSYADARARPGSMAPKEVADALRVVAQRADSIDAKAAAFLREEADAVEQFIARPLYPGDVSSRVYMAGLRTQNEAAREALRAAGEGVVDVPPVGQNVRAIDVPKGLKLFNIDRVHSDRTVDRIVDHLLDVDEEVAFAFQDAVGSRPTGREIYDALEEAMGGDKAWVNEQLEALGYSGIRHTGGQMRPLLDGKGKPIKHDVTIVFPGSLDRIRNAFSGEAGGSGFVPAASTLRNAAQGALVGAASEDLQAQAEGREADPTSRLVRGVMGAGLGIVAGRAAGRQAGQQLGSGFVPNIPGVQQAVQAAQQRQARMAARGVQPLSPLAWTGEAIKNVGYSSMIGPATATVNVLGNMLEPLWAIPKEATRSVVRGNPREFGEMTLGAFYGLSQTGREMLDAIKARGRYASNPDQPRLSERTINPIGHAFATATEAGGRLFSGLPDAFFGTISRHAGAAREAAQIATDEGLKGSAWKQRVTDLLQETEVQRQGGLSRFPSETDRIIKAGDAYADRQTFRDELGTWGKGASKWAGRDVPVIGNFLTPFFTTPWNMNVAMLERTPVGAVMNRQKGFDKAYDATLGSALLAGLVVGPAAAGKITGSGPDDAEKRQMLQAEGWKPYHTLIGDTYVPNRVFGIYGRVLNAVGDAHDAMAYQKKDAGAREIITDVGKRVGKLIKEEPYLQGLADILDAFDSAGSGMEYLIGSNAARLVPYAATARTIGTAMDPSERTTDRGKEVPLAEGVRQRVESNLGMRSDLPVAQDALGRERENQQQGIWSVLPRMSPRKAEPTIAAFREAGVDIGFPRDKLTVDGIDVPLTPPEQRKWQTYRGEILARFAPGMREKSWWSNPQARETAMRDILRQANETADQRVMRDIGAEAVRRRVREGVQKRRAS